MIWEEIFQSLVEYGFAGIVAGVLLWLLARTLKSFMCGLKDTSANYMKIIEDKELTQQNHIGHLTDSVAEQSKVVAQQGEKFKNGVDKICDTLENQTFILKEYIKGNKNG